MKKQISGLNRFLLVLVMVLVLGDNNISAQYIGNAYPLAELNKRIFKSANRFVVNVVYILKDCKCTYFP